MGPGGGVEGGCGGRVGVEGGRVGGREGRRGNKKCDLTSNERGMEEKFAQVQPNSLSDC